MIMDGEKQRRYSVVLVWLTLETVNIGTLWESGTLDMDILHSVHTSPPCRALIIAYIQYRSTTGKFVRGEKNCGKYLFLMSRAQCGDGC